MTPTEVTDLDLAFPAGVIGKLLPEWDKIPAEYKKSTHPAVKLAEAWFYTGLSKDAEFEPRPNIDFKKAIRHISVVMRSYEPKQEHKMAGVAYLLDSFFEKLPNK
jgi:hypothetical protein